MSLSPKVNDLDSLDLYFTSRIHVGLMIALATIY